MMTRLDHLTYCCVCKNRKFTTDNGFICGLTNKIADFDNRCVDFVLDEEAKRVLTSKIEKEIDESIKNRNTWVKNVFNDKPILDFLPYDKSKLHPIKEKEYIVKEAAKKKTTMIMAVVGLIGATIYAGLRDGIKFDDQPTIIGLLFIVGLSAAMLYFISQTSELLRIGELGIILKKKEFIPWHQIDFIHLKTVKQKYEHAKYLVIRPSFGDNRELEITHADKDVNELGTQLIDYKNRFKVN